MNLNELLTSEFSDGYTNDELLNILIQFRKKYRELHSENVRLKRFIQCKEKDIINIKENINKKEKIINTLRERLHKGRKLTFKERMVGKINKF